ncbi:MAG: 1-(5-phosphoribosyl)-5-[(5-phosphoribosylamino)methylideneamino]imidazole-4-carboxamide isomerase [Oscillatoriales cyanobacterium]|nr:MAG: 1-(5-phosphoribosyl)-5-[(5-phosphoribosylamino)methylideneamino]imidazole-4-carboxamide isomerase [Oscillatoriales cyanobacterium]
MDIFPAIDLLGGHCVRLFQGDYDRAESFGDDPAAVARRWADAGASWLHLVDLDGAKTGEPVNLPAIAAIVEALADRSDQSGRSVQIQVGGGVRSRDRAAALFDLGVTRAIVGTVAVEQPAVVADWCAEFPGRIVIGIDAREGWVATRGWLETSQVRAVDLARQVQDWGAAAIVYTDIQRDGTLSGPNQAALRELAEGVTIPVIASGGVSSVTDLLSLLTLEPVGVTGAIVGRALYTGNVDLQEALQAVGPGRWQDVPIDLGQQAIG